MKMSFRLPSILLATALICGSVFSQSGIERTTWRYFRPGNTGIQGDYCESLWIGPEGDPWIAGYDATFEEGGIAKFIQAENRWFNVSTVDHEPMGNPVETGSARVSDIAVDSRGTMWMATGCGALEYNPTIGHRSPKRFGVLNSPIMGGWTTGVEVAPDGTIWFSAYATVWGAGGLARYNPITRQWQVFPDYGDGYLAVQPKPSNGYYVWSRSYTLGAFARWDSASGAFTVIPESTGQPGRPLGKNATDAAGNTWMHRLTGNSSALVAVDLRRSNGTWVGVPQLPNGNTGIQALRTIGVQQAVAVDGTNRVWRFNGTSWTDLGHWGSQNYTYDVGQDAAGNVWVCGIGGASKRTAATGLWQRYRITNTGNIDSFNRDIALDNKGGLYAAANGAPGIGGMAHFDGQRWTGFNQITYGLGGNWPFSQDNIDSVTVRANGNVVVNPMYGGLYEFDGTNWTSIGGLSTVRSMAEDSFGRLWALGDYYNLSVLNGATWTNVGIISWAGVVKKDPDRPGTVWAQTLHEVKRTDGVYSFSRTIDDFPELTSQSDTFTGIAVGRNGIVWIGCTVMLGAGGNGGGLIRLDSNTGAYTLITYDNGWPLPGKYVWPLGVSPDGKVWIGYTNQYQYFEGGLCWFDGKNVGEFPGPPSGQPQWGGLPHTQIQDMEIREVADGYELWMSCLSRGIAVLKVKTQNPRRGSGPFDESGELDPR